MNPIHSFVKNVEQLWDIAACVPIVANRWICWQTFVSIARHTYAASDARFAEQKWLKPMPFVPNVELK